LVLVGIYLSINPGNKTDLLSTGSHIKAKGKKMAD